MRYLRATMRFNTNNGSVVPIFLAALWLLLAVACGGDRGETDGVELRADEVHFVEQYLRMVEARQLAVSGDSLAEGRFALLETALPADSLRAFARRLSAEEPTRWALIYEEIVRRKKIMESESR